MNRRWRLLALLSAPLAALGAGAWWWHRTTPPWEWAWVPWGSEDDLRYAYEGELRAPGVAAAVGYSAIQRRADDAVRANAAAEWNKADMEARRLEDDHVPEETVRRYRSAAAERARQDMDGWLPCLSQGQKSRLWPHLVRWTGVWVMADRRVAARVGLSEAQRAEIARTADRVRWYYNDEHNAWGRQVTIFEGAPASAIAALGEQQRHTIRCLDRWQEADCQTEGQTISDRTIFSPSRSVPAWVDSLGYDLVVRRAVAFRREEEARLLGTLTPDQRQRWESLKAGRDPV